MGTTDANGIYFYDDTDGAPTPPVLNVGQQSVSDAIGVMHTYKVVANVTARDALVTSFAPSPTKPLYVHRIDAVVGSQMEYSIGSGFRKVSPVGGVISGTLNTFGQIAISHGLGYVPTEVSLTMTNDVTSGDPAVSESATKDYDVTLYNKTSDIIIARLVNKVTGGWATGGGARFALQWSAR